MLAGARRRPLVGLSRGSRRGAHMPLASDMADDVAAAMAASDALGR